jgi:hypothetical protein
MLINEKFEAVTTFLSSDKIQKEKIQKSIEHFIQNDYIFSTDLFLFGINVLKNNKFSIERLSIDAVVTIYDEVFESDTKSFEEMKGVFLKSDYFKNLSSGFEIVQHKCII